MPESKRLSHNKVPVANIAQPTGLKVLLFVFKSP